MPGGTTGQWVSFSGRPSPSHLGQFRETLLLKLLVSVDKVKELDEVLIARGRRHL